MCVDCVVLSLDGTLHHTDGVLPMVSIAKNHGIETVYVPYEDAPRPGWSRALCARWPTWPRISAACCPLQPYLAEAVETAVVPLRKDGFALCFNSSPLAHTGTTGEVVRLIGLNNLVVRIDDNAELTVGIETA
jgi:hypothetical protein